MEDYKLSNDGLTDAVKAVESVSVRECGAVKHISVVGKICSAVR